MKLFLLVSMALLLFTIPALAQDKQNLPDKPQPQFAGKVSGLSRADWVLLAADGAATAFDYAETAHGSRPGTGFHEGDPLLGNHPGDARLAATGVADIAAMYLVLRFGEHSRHKWVRVLSKVVVGADIGGHVYGGAAWAAKQ